jgi:hypothetical protein
MAGPDQTKREQLIQRLDEAALAIRDWTKAQTASTTISIAVHVSLIVALWLIQQNLQTTENLAMSLRFGDKNSLDSEKFVGETLKFDPLTMPAIDVTKMAQNFDETASLTPDLPRIEFHDDFDLTSEKKQGEEVSVKGFGTAQFDGLSEKVQGVSVKIGDPQFTLIWDSDADLDLHVIEPGGSEIYWEARNAKKGGELDVDDVDGQGPENIYWKKGVGPSGDYQWWVHYYGGLGGKPKRTKWRVRIKHAGQLDEFDGVLSKIDSKSPVQILKK